MTKQNHRTPKGKPARSYQPDPQAAREKRKAKALFAERQRQQDKREWRALLSIWE